MHVHISIMLLLFLILEMEKVKHLVNGLRFAGPVSSFLVISDPAAAKHVLRATDNPNQPLYVKGLVAEVRLALP